MTRRQKHSIAPNMTDEVEGERKSVASPPDLVTDPVEVARKEASNGLRQFDAVVGRESTKHDLSRGHFGCGRPIF